MKKRFLFTTLLLGGLILTGCGNTTNMPQDDHNNDNQENNDKPDTNPEDNEQEVEKESLKATLSFALPVDHFTIGNYNEGHLEDFKTAFLDNEIIDAPLTSSFTLESIFGGTGHIDDGKYLPFVKFGSGKNTGSFKINYNQEIVKTIKKVELEVFPYLITYNGTIEHASISVNEGEYINIPDVQGTTNDDIQSTILTYENDIISDPSKGLTIKSGYVDAKSGGARFYLKNINITYIPF